MDEREMSVLVAIDGTDASTEAARWAGAVAHRMGARLHLVHAMRSVDEALLVISAPQQEDAGSYARELGHKVLKRAAGAVCADIPALLISRTLGRRSIVEILVDLSRHARLVVLACDDVTPGGALLVGSTTLKVATHAQCPVVAWRGKNHRPVSSPIVVGVGDDDASRAALVTALGLADLFGVDLKAVHSLPEVAATGDLDVSAIVDWDLLEKTAQQRLSDLIAEVDDHWRSVHVSSVIKTGRAGRVILDNAVGAQLIVVGARTRGTMSRVLLGSTVLNLLHHAPVPIVLCPASFVWQTPSADPQNQSAAGVGRSRT